jgi:hypothetical protein
VADQAAQALHDRRALTVTLIVVSGAPGTGKSTIAAALGAALRFPVLSLDPIKEALADVLGLGGEDWSNQVGDAAAEASGDFVVVGGRVLDGVVEEAGGEGMRIRDVELVAEDAHHGAGVFDVGGDAVASELVEVFAGGEVVGGGEIRIDHGPSISGAGRGSQWERGET